MSKQEQNLKAVPTDKVRESEIFWRREHGMFHSSYSSEKLRYATIRKGQTEDLPLVMNNPEDGVAGRLSSNELRHHKNMLIAAITIYTRAAMDGGLPEEQAYAMSDSFILSGEECQSIDLLEQLNRKAITDFTYAVAAHGKKHYTILIEKAMHFIHVNLHEQLLLEDIAEYAGISTCYLSRLFKKETGGSIVEYIQRERVEAAKNMLVYSDYTAEDISQYLHFSTQSYFIRIFKKYMDMTPEYYRKHYKEESQW